MTPDKLAQELTKNKEAVSAVIAEAGTAAELEKLKNKLIGKSSQIIELRKKVGEMQKDARPEAGQILNAALEELTHIYEARLAELNSKDYSASQKEQSQDLTAVISGPNNQFASQNINQNINLGHLHPVTQMQWRLEDIFSSMGFKIAEGPEAETEWNNFEALNFPPGHPARDMYDSLYINHGDPASTLLRTHTSPVQVRTMLSQPPPIFVVAPGRCYRRDTTDATHMPVFHQIEGLVVDVGITFGDLAGIIEEFIKILFGAEFESRLRPSYFPFTEPSAEFDIFVPETQTSNKNAGTWMEMGGCGMVHPEVFKACGIDPEKYTGFAFGFGIDRLAMMEFGIDDLREFWTGDVRFLKQF